MSFASRSSSVLRLATTSFRSRLVSGSRDLSVPQGVAGSQRIRMFSKATEIPNRRYSSVVDHAEQRLDNISDEARHFYRSYTPIINKLAADIVGKLKDGDVAERCKEILDYNVPHGKRVCGLSVVNAYKHMASPAQLTEENLKLVRIVAWAVEVMHGFFQVADDIMDQSLTRRGKPCWYKRSDVGHNAVNDIAYLEACVFEILRQNVRDQPYYLDIIEAFHETIYKTIVGQGMDMIMTTKKPAHMTEETYHNLVEHKTTYLTCYSSFAIAMYLAGVVDAESHANAKTILGQMGVLCQMKNDFDDCFTTSGKKGTDIEQNKCSWLMVEAMKRANWEQRQILEDNYGIEDEENAARVKKVYEDLKLPELYRKTTEESAARLSKLIDENHGSLPKEMFTDFAHILFGNGASSLMSYDEAVSRN